MIKIKYVGALNTLFFFIILERALRALASSSGGAACPGATHGQPRGSTLGVRGWFLGDLSEKNFVTDERTDGRTDRNDGRNSYLDKWLPAGHRLAARHCWSDQGLSCQFFQEKKFKICCLQLSSQANFPIFYTNNFKSGFPMGWRKLQLEKSPKVSSVSLLCTS